MPLTLADLHIHFARTMSELCEMNLEELFWRAASAGLKLVVSSRNGLVDATPGEWVAACAEGRAFGVRP